jgi:hypothetical protein
MAAFDFDVSSYVDDRPSTFEPLAPGEYTAMVSASDLKDTKAGTGQYIELVIDIIDGPSAGRKIWERLNIVNPNKQAEDISRVALNRLLVACGKPDAKDTESIHDVPFQLILDIDRKDPTRNKVITYKPAQTFSAARIAVTSSVASPSTKKAWEK